MQSHDKIIELLTRQISSFPEVESLILYGSRSRQDHKFNSDIDLAVTGNINEATWTMIWNMVDAAPTLLKIDIVRFEKVDEALQTNIKHEGIKLYERK